MEVGGSGCSAPADGACVLVHTATVGRKGVYVEFQHTTELVISTLGCWPCLSQAPFPSGVLRVARTKLCRRGSRLEANLRKKMEKTNHFVLSWTGAEFIDIRFIRFPL